MSQSQKLSFSSPVARFQYHLLMFLFRLAVTRGFYGRFARGLGHVFAAKNAVYLKQNDEPAFKIYLNDGYWTRFALFHHDYEPEVEKVIQAAAGHTRLFCDLGANKGYWSVRAAPLFPQIFSVEASTQTFEVLSENTAALSNVTTYKKAIHSVSGQTLTFLNVPLSHASARIAQPSEGADETVETMAIDDLIPADTPSLIKLDVEGAEIAALDGGKRTLGEGSVFIYEDHGNDPGCLASAHLLKNDKIGIYSTFGEPKQLKSVAEIRALKTDVFKGYNFIAARNDSALLAAILNNFANH